MVKFYRTSSGNRTLHSPVSNLERGFTYLEVLVALSIILFLLPLMFEVMGQIKNEFTSTVLGSKLRMEYLFCTYFLEQDLCYAKYFKKTDQKLEFCTCEPAARRELEICYSLQKGSLVRSIRPKGKRFYKGYTILLEHVKDIEWRLKKGYLQLVVHLSYKGLNYKINEVIQTSCGR